MASPGGVLTFCDQFSGATDRLYRKHMANWRQAARELGATDQQWQQWMEHQREHDFHSSLQAHCELLRIAGFETVDCTRRFFLWTTLICQ
ncbi:MAG: hypothetical protein VX768_19245 [Planctomycetota bacterium]|nr:hypothetical protein [Planctomycetota bacterium]